MMAPPAEAAAPPAKARRWGWIETGTLAGFAAVVAAGIAWHEPWSDEAQAWLLARHMGWWRMMTHALHYEGSPGLWHTLLWILARLHVSFMGMHWVSGVLAAAGVAVLLRWSPFPLALRVLLPFGFWLAYQDAVVARSYVAFAVLAFPAAALIRGMARAETPPRTLPALALILGLLANLSLHGLVMSLGFAAVAATVLWRKSRSGVQVRGAAAAAILLVFWAIAIATGAPSGEVSFQAGRNLDRSVARIAASLGDAHAKASLKQPSVPAQDVHPNELAPLAIRNVPRSRSRALWLEAARLLGLLTFPVSTFRWLGLAVCALLIAQAIGAGRDPRNPGWVGLMPWLLVVAVFFRIYLEPRHAGVIWVGLLSAAWLTWPERPATTSRGVWMRRATVAGLLLVALEQAGWTAHAVNADIHRPYSGGVAMARFLQSAGPGKRIAGFCYNSIAVAVWFPHRIYFNQPHAYWAWSRKVRIDQEAPATIATHPDIIVVGGFALSARNGSVSDDWAKPDAADNLNWPPLHDDYGIVPYAEAHGYRETHRFCGHTFMRDGYSKELCEVALQPVR